MNPYKKEVDAARAAVLPLDCPDEAIASLFEPQPQEVITHNHRFQQYLDAAYDHHRTEPTPLPEPLTPYQVAAFPALAMLRLHRADPLKDTKYEKQEPPGSAESRMLRRPLQKHPGLTEFGRCARTYYIATVSWFFKHRCPENLQKEIIAVLYLEPSSETPARGYADKDNQTVFEKHEDHISINDDSIWIDKNHHTQAIQLGPQYERIHYVEDTDDLPQIEIDRSGVTIPWTIFRYKLAEYSWHGWAKLVHTAYNTFSEYEYDEFVEKTPGIEATLFPKYKRNNPVYRPKYSVEFDNPKQSWDPDLPKREYYHLEDKRLITAVDCIRASPNLTFTDPIPIQTLYDNLKRYFPPPHRPGNDISNINTLKSAVDKAETSSIKLIQHEASGTVLCKFPKPVDTPLFPGNEHKYWDTYLEHHNQHRQNTPEKRISDSYGHRDWYIQPTLPKHEAQRITENTDTQRTAAQAAAATTQSLLGTIQDVDDAYRFGTYEKLTEDEMIFLSRISHAMERQISDYSLTNSMRTLRFQPDGTELNINPEKLEELGVLETHDEGNALLYTVPHEIRKALHVKNISNDGYGEKTTSEKSLHRKGIDLTAAYFATKPDVTRVVRYHDLWRLRNTACETPLEQNNLLSTRIDVIAYQEDTPKYVAEVETAGNDTTRTERCIQKLTAFTPVESIHTTLVTPNPDHITDLMNHVNRTSFYEFDSFPSTTDNYTRTTWKRKLKKEGLINDHFDALHTYKTIKQQTTANSNTDHLQKVVGNI